MPKNNLSIKVGGEAGQGVESGGAGFSKALVRGGLWVFGASDYMSRIRGGHNFFHARVSETPILTHVDDVHFSLHSIRMRLDSTWMRSSRVVELSTTRPLR